MPEVPISKIQNLSKIYGSGVKDQNPVNPKTTTDESQDSTLASSKPGVAQSYVKPLTGSETFKKPSQTAVPQRSTTSVDFNSSLQSSKDAVSASTSSPKSTVAQSSSPASAAVPSVPISVQSSSKTDAPTSTYKTFSRPSGLPASAKPPTKSSVVSAGTTSFSSTTLKSSATPSSLATVASLPTTVTQADQEKSGFLAKHKAYELSSTQQNKPIKPVVEKTPLVKVPQTSAHGSKPVIKTDHVAVKGVQVLPSTIASGPATAPKPASVVPEPASRGVKDAFAVFGAKRNLKKI